MGLWLDLSLCEGPDHLAERLCRNNMELRLMKLSEGRLLDLAWCSGVGLKIVAPASCKRIFYGQGSLDCWLNLGPDVVRS